MRYLALAADYDGTLAHHGRVDDATIAALEEVHRSGRKTVLVTGRLLDDLVTVFPQLDLFDYLEEPRGTPQTDFERFALIAHAFLSVVERGDAARATDLVHRALTVEEHGYYESVMRASVGPAHSSR